MRVLHLMSSGGLYGAETMLLNLAAAQKKLGCDPVIGVFHNRRRPHLEVASEARKRNLRVEIFDCAGRFDSKALGAIRKFIRSNGMDLVHGHGYKSDLYGYLATRWQQAAFVGTCHLWTGGTRQLQFYESLDALILRRARKVVGVSDAITEALRRSGIARSKLSTIYNGTDFARFESAQASLRQELGIGNRRLIGTVGRLEEQKGIEYFVRAAREVIAEFPDAFFVVIGEGSLRHKLLQLTRELGLDSCVRLLGERSDMPGVYTSLDLFVLASIDEGMPMTILEALAAARPVIATNVGAVAKLVISEQTGLLVEPRNPAALRDAMLCCLRNSARATELAKNGKRHVLRSFSAEAMANHYLEIYNQALHECPDRLASAALQRS